MTRLLLVEDDGALLAALDDLLDIEGHDVTLAESAEAALDSINEMGKPVDLIVSDVIMPGISGVEMLKRIRQLPAWVRIPCLFISASTTLRMEGEILRMERVTFMSKPFAIDDFLEKIEELSQGEGE